MSVRRHAFARLPRRLGIQRTYASATRRDSIDIRRGASANSNCAHVSFHGISGMYDFADAGMGLTGRRSRAVFQNVDIRVAWSKSVPPQPRYMASKRTHSPAKPNVAVCAVLKLSHPAEPLSPAETTTVIP